MALAAQALQPLVESTIIKSGKFDARLIDSRGTGREFFASPPGTPPPPFASVAEGIQPLQLRRVPAHMHGSLEISGSGHGGKSHAVVALEELAQGAHPLGEKRFPGQIQPRHGLLAMHKQALRLRY